MENKYYQDMVELIELYDMLHTTSVISLKDEERIEKLKEFRILIDNFYKIDPQNGCIRDRDENQNKVVGQFNTYLWEKAEEY